MINVNLLPDEIKTNLAQAKKNSAVTGLLYRILGLVVIAVVIFLGFNFYFEQDLKQQKFLYEQTQQKISGYGELQESARRVAEKLTTIKKIKATNSVWSGLIEEVNKVVPAGIYLNSVKVDSNIKIRGQLTGFGISKNEVATFRDNLEKSDKFEFVDIEKSTTQIEPTSKKEIENFTITLSIEKGALK